MTEIAGTVSSKSFLGARKIGARSVVRSSSITIKKPLAKSKLTAKARIKVATKITTKKPMAKYTNIKLEKKPAKGKIVGTRTKVKLGTKKPIAKITRTPIKANKLADRSKRTPVEIKLSPKDREKFKELSIKEKEKLKIFLQKEKEKLHSAHQKAQDKLAAHKARTVHKDLRKPTASTKPAITKGLKASAKIKAKPKTLAGRVSSMSKQITAAKKKALSGNKHADKLKADIKKSTYKLKHPKAAPYKTLGSKSTKPGTDAKKTLFKRYDIKKAGVNNSATLAKISPKASLKATLENFKNTTKATDKLSNNAHLNNAKKAVTIMKLKRIKIGADTELADKAKWDFPVERP